MPASTPRPPRAGGGEEGKEPSRRASSKAPTRGSTGGLSRFVEARPATAYRSRRGRATLAHPDPGGGRGPGSAGQNRVEIGDLAQPLDLARRTAGPSARSRRTCGIQRAARRRRAAPVVPEEVWRSSAMGKVRRLGSPARPHRVLESASSIAVGYGSRPVTPKRQQSVEVRSSSPRRARRHPPAAYTARSARSSCYELMELG